VDPHRCPHGSAADDLVLFAMTFRVLTTAELTLRQGLRGALLSTAIMQSE
jgi:hypothetical protein